MSLAQIRHWVFDLDGTLTLAVHDFPAIKQALEIPPQADILSHLAALPVAEAAAKHAWLLEHERQLAEASRPATGAVKLVCALQDAGHQLGILTRNARELALITLEAIGLRECFRHADILGRDEAIPKPNADGLLRLAAAWAVAPQQLLMVGDHCFDLQCARAAGARSALVNLAENPWPELTDWHVQDCAELGRLAGVLH